MYYQAINKKICKNKCLSFLGITCFIISIDQLSKFLIVKIIPYGSIHKIIGDFLWIVHERNKGVAFGMGLTLENTWRTIIIYVIPLILISYLLWFTFFSKQPKIYKLLTATMLGGGIGNMIDRIYRPEGVVDFISVKFYGILGFERWPTFNIADTSIVISIIIWIIATFFFQKSVLNDEAKK